MRRLGAWMAVLAGLTACGRAPAFQCTQDSQCEAGQCEPSTGYCSFVDEGCPSGWKYGAHAGQGLAGQCVDPGGSGDAGTTDPGDDDVADDGPGPGVGTTPSDDGDSTSGPSATNSTGVPDTDDGTACDGTCLDAPPEGWLGPAAVLAATGAIPACPDALPTTLAVGHTMLQADPATCGCGCDPVPGSCGDITISVDELGGTCDMGIDITLAENDCVDLTSTAASATVAHPADPGAGSCDTNTFMEVTPPAWVDHLRACAAPAPACDADTVCLPAVADADICILRAGDVPCPAGAYSDRTIVYGDYLDERDCSDCGCEVQGPVCRIELRYGSDCTGAPDVAWTTDTAHCETFAIPVGEAFTAEHDTVDNCAGVGGDPIGEVVPIDPTTLCCVP